MIELLNQKSFVLWREKARARQRRIKYNVVVGIDFWVVGIFLFLYFCQIFSRIYVHMCIISKHAMIRCLRKKSSKYAQENLMYKNKRGHFYLSLLERAEMISNEIFPENHFSCFLLQFRCLRRNWLGKCREN